MSFVTQTPTHPTISPDATTVPAGVARAFRPALNTYVGAVEDKVQSVQAFLEGLIGQIGNGAISGGAISAGVGASVNVAALVAFVGNRVEFNASQTVGGLTLSATNTLFLRQDGTWTVNTTGANPTDLSAHGAFLKWGTATCDGSGVTSVSNIRDGFSLPGIPIIDVRKYGAKGDGTTDDTAAIQAALNYVGASSRGGVVYVPAGQYKCSSVLTWPTKSNIHLIGQGRELTTLDFATSTTGGISYTTSSTKIQHCSIEDMTIHGGGASSGVGLLLQDWDRGWTKNLRVYVWDTCIKLDSSLTRGAIHTKHYNNIVTNGTTYGYWLTGAQGPHQCSIWDGEASICGTGIQIDSPTDQTRVKGTSVESNTVGIKTAGRRSRFDVRFEGNTTDMYFDTTAYYNVLYTPFFDPAKHVDVATGAGVDTNRVEAWGFASSATELLPMLFVPMNPMAVTLASIVPGNLAALSHRFQVDRVRKVTTVSYVPSVQSGNVSIAITDAAGTVLGVTASTAVGTAGTRQDIALTSPIFLGPFRQYFISIQFDNGTAGVYGVVSSSAGFNLAQVVGLAKTKNLASAPIAAQNTISGASTTTSVPFFALT